MKLTTRKIPSINVVEIAGIMSHTDSDGLGVLRAHVEGLLAAGERNLIINLHKVTIMDSAGIGEIAACCKKIETLEGAMKVVVQHKSKPAISLRVTQLDRAFPLFDTLEEAVASFAK